MDICTNEDHKEEMIYYCISDGMRGCNKCMTQYHQGHLYIQMPDIINNALQNKIPLESKTILLTNYDKLISSLSLRIEFKKKALSLISEAFRNSIVKYISGSIKGDIAFYGKVKARRTDVEANILKVPSIPNDKKASIEDMLKNRKWGSAAEELTDTLKYMESQEHINIFSAEFSKSEINLEFLRDFIQYMSNMEQEIYANLEKKDIEFDKLLKLLSDNKVMGLSDHLH